VKKKRNFSQFVDQIFLRFFSVSALLLILHYDLNKEMQNKGHGFYLTFF